jgi:hypothetical protein
MPKELLSLLIEDSTAQFQLSDRSAAWNQECTDGLILKGLLLQPVSFYTFLGKSFVITFKFYYLWYEIDL